MEWDLHAYCGVIPQGSTFLEFFFEYVASTFEEDFNNGIDVFLLGVEFVLSSCPRRNKE